MKLIFFNVGYGEAILLSCPRPEKEPFRVLVDGGSNDAEEYRDSGTGRLPLWKSLTSRGIRHIDLMIATHLHEDHLCGLLPVAERCSVGVFLSPLPPDFTDGLSPLPSPPGYTSSQRKFTAALNDYLRLVDILRASGCAIRQAPPGQDLALCPNFTLHFLEAAGDRLGELRAALADLWSERRSKTFSSRLTALDEAMNNYSLVLRFTAGGRTILLPGDANALGLSAYPAGELRADIFKVGHHGQRDGVSPGLMDAVRPSTVVCCASSDRRYNSAHPQSLRLLARDGAALWFSDCPPAAEGAAPPPHCALTFSLEEGEPLRGVYESPTEVDS